jgi:hypothetical protein
MYIYIHIYMYIYTYIYKTHSSVTYVCSNSLRIFLNVENRTSDGVFYVCKYIYYIYIYVYIYMYIYIRIYLDINHIEI